MKVTNFRNYKEHLPPNPHGYPGEIAKIGTNYSATVDVTTGIFFKKTVTKQVFREWGGYWIFTENGEYCDLIEPLFRAYKAKNLTKELV